MRPIATEPVTSETQTTRGLIDRIALLFALALGLGPLINRQGIEKVRRHVEDALDRGARLVIGGAPLTSGDLARGHFFATGNNIREADGTLDNGKTGEAIFWQTLKLDRK